MIKYWVRVPSWAGGVAAYGYNKKDALSRFKKQYGFKRMPKGYGIWEAIT